MPKKIKIENIRPKLKVFSINTYSACEIEADNHHRKFICTFPEHDRFEFSIDVDRSQLTVEFQCIYFDAQDRGVVLYRGEPNDHIHEFWTDLGNEYHKRTSGYQDQLRERVLKQFNFDWEG